MPKKATNATAMPIDEAAPPLLRGALPSFNGAAVAVAGAEDALGVVTALPILAVDTGDGGVMRGLGAVEDTSGRAAATATEGVGERVDVGVGERDAELDLPGAGSGAVVSFRR